MQTSFSPNLRCLSHDVSNFSLQSWKSLLKTAAFGLCLLPFVGSVTQAQTTLLSENFSTAFPHDARNSPQWNNRVAAACSFDFVRTGRFSLEGLATHTFKPAQCVEAYALASTDRLRTLGVLFDWTAERGVVGATAPAEHPGQPVGVGA
ncbi:MAG: hypothetical protein WC661_19195 [Opitutaceae bacterium]|jgi:hypothetical protein